MTPIAALLIGIATGWKLRGLAYAWLRSRR